MGIGTRTAAVWVLVCLHSASTAAQAKVMTLSDVLARAREQAPQIVSARLAVEEARGRLVGASVRLRANPQLDAAVGNRSGQDTRFTDFEVAIGQAFEPAARRSARIDSASAAVSQSTANVDEAVRTVLRSAASAYYRVLHADERIRLLENAYSLAANVYSTADRRFQAGDIAVLDVNIARASLARVRADREAAEASKALALAELRELLRLDRDASVGGSLSPLGERNLNAALEASSARPELRMLDADIQEAEAELRLGQSFSRPDYGLGVRYSREEGDQIVLGGMTVTLPMFAKGQEERAVGSARAARLRAELDAARARIRGEVQAAFDAYSRRLAAVRVLEMDAIPGLDENERLATRSFDVGQLGLPELLLIRREILETRFQYVDALLEAALAQADLDASAAMLR
ncbi:MAG TPA: TolC family protein [Vicinamibacterales bacterium]|nr:TolC family protein [Vicinamibacterales bacterium]